jgi:enoyl-CoA hydratase
MPETGIGLFPDVGGSYFLPRMPGSLGVYMALTGARLRAADCLYGGIADVFVPAARHDDLIAALRGGDTEAALQKFAAHAGAAPLATHRVAIDRCFADETVEAIVRALEQEGSEWARATLRTMAGKSPTSQKIALRQIRLGAALGFDDCMRMEFRLSQHLMAAHDFFEGVRAVVIDKDQAPRWRPARLEEVSDAAIQGYFAPLGDAELTFG